MRVMSGEQLVIKNMTLNLEGNLILEEGSSLLMEDAALVVKQRYKSEYWIEAINAEVILINSEIDTSESVMVDIAGRLLGTELNITLSGGSRAHIENSSVYGRLSLEQSSRAELLDSTVSFIYWKYDAHVQASRVTMGSFAFYGNESLPENLYFNGLKRDQEFDLAIESTADGGSLSLEDCIVKGMWYFNFDWGCQKMVTIEDSEVDAPIAIKFPPTDEWITIDGLPSGFLSEYDLSEAVSGLSLTYGVRLINVNMSAFKPEMLSTKATITNSYAMVHPYDNAELIIKDSTLISMYNYGCKRIDFFNVTFLNVVQFLSKPEFAGGFSINGRLIGPGGYFHWVLSNSVMNVSDIVVAHEEGTIEGELTIISPTNIENVHWEKGIITRIYPVIAQPNETITLLQDGVTVWSGQADENGEASFSITFNEDNYTGVFTLQTEEDSQEVTFLSSTPLDMR